MIPPPVVPPGPPPLQGMQNNVCTNTLRMKSTMGDKKGVVMQAQQGLEMSYDLAVQDEFAMARWESQHK